MKRVLVLCAAILLMAAAPLWAQNNQSPQAMQPQRPGYGGRGMGSGMMGPGMGGSGYGQGNMGYGMNPSQEGWVGMSPEQRQLWQKMRSQYMADTLALRQELSVKQMELQTLWQQSNPDQSRLSELSKQVADLRAKLAQQHDQYLNQCRQQFGDRGWACPGLGAGGY